MKTKLLLLFTLFCICFTFAQNNQFTVINTTSSAITQTSATVQGDVLIDCVAGANYNLQYSTNSIFTGPETINLPFAGTANTTKIVNLTNLTPGTTYFWRFKGSYNAGGGCNLNITSSPTRSFITLTYPKPLISGIAATPFANSATINYSLIANNYATTSIVKYGTASGSLTSQVAGFNATGNALTTSFASISGLANNTQYFYQIEATNAGGTTVDNERTFTTTSLPPGISYSLLNATAITTTTATVNATITNTCPAAGTYNFQISEFQNYAVLLSQGQNNIVVAANSSAVKSINLTSLTPNKRYYYRFYNNANQSCGNNVVYSGSGIFETVSASTGIMFSNVNSSAINDTSATVGVTLSNACAGSIYNLQYSTNIYFASAVTTQTFSTGVTNGVKNHTITGLTPNTKYYYRFYSGVNQACNTVQEVSFQEDFTTIATVIVPQLIAEYNFNNTLNNINGNTPFASNSINYETGRNSNAGNALRLNGVGTSTTIANLPVGNLPRTVSIWYKVVSNTNDNCLFVYGASGGENAYGVSFNNSNTWYNFAWNTNTSMNNPSNDGQWHHLVTTFDETKTSKIYVDGVLKNTVVQNGWNTSTGGNVFWLGGVFAINTSTYNGVVDDLKIYNYALTQAEINNLFANNSTLATTEGGAISNTEISIYPNPAKDFVTIQSENKVKSVEIFTIEGRLVLTAKESKINTSSLKSGVYLMKITDAKNNVTGKKLIIK